MKWSDYDSTHRLVNGVVTVDELGLEMEFQTPNEAQIRYILWFKSSDCFISGIPFRSSKPESQMIKRDIKKTNGRKSTHDTNNITTSNATNYHRCNVKMYFHRHVGLYGNFTSSSFRHKRKRAGSRKCFYFCQYPRLHGVKDTRINTCMTHWWNDTDGGKLKPRRKENLSHFHYVHQISYRNRPGIKHQPPNMNETMKQDTYTLVTSL